MGISLHVQDDQGTICAAISRELVQLHKRLTGRGPKLVRTYIHEASVVVLMGDGHTPLEEGLRVAGRGREVSQARLDLFELHRDEFIEVVDRHLGRPVIGFMTGSQQEPSLIAHVFVLGGGSSVP